MCIIESVRTLQTRKRGRFSGVFADFAEFRRVFAKSNSDTSHYLGIACGDAVRDLANLIVWSGRVCPEMLAGWCFARWMTRQFVPFRPSTPPSRSFSPCRLDRIIVIRSIRSIPTAFFEAFASLMDRIASRESGFDPFGPAAQHVLQFSPTPVDRSPR